MRRPALPVAAATLALALTLPTGCAQSPRQTTVDPSPPRVETSGTLTPLQRGQERRAALAAAESAVKAFLDDDSSAIEQRFSQQYATLWQQKRAARNDRGLRRERRHEREFLDIVELSDSGRQAIGQYRFKDLSKTYDRSGAVLQQDTSGKVREWDMTLQKQADGSWRATRVIGFAATLE